jgi:hypothetical protein
MAAILTGDADIAQDYAVSREVEDSLPPILDLLRSVDPTFRPVPHRSGSAASRAFSWQEGLAAGIALMPANGKEALAAALCDVAAINSVIFLTSEAG